MTYWSLDKLKEYLKYSASTRFLNDPDSYSRWYDNLLRWKNETTFRCQFCPRMYFFGECHYGVFCLHSHETGKRYQKGIYSNAPFWSISIKRNDERNIYSVGYDQRKERDFYSIFKEGGKKPWMRISDREFAMAIAGSRPAWYAKWAKRNGDLLLPSPCNYH